MLDVSVNKILRMSRLLKEGEREKRRMGYTKGTDPTQICLE